MLSWCEYNQFVSPLAKPSLCRMTCADQTFFTGFATSDLSVKLYAMNFRKGSQINR